MRTAREWRLFTAAQEAGRLMGEWVAVAIEDDFDLHALRAFMRSPAGHAEAA